MFFKNKLLYFVSIFLLIPINALFAGFAAGTLIKVPGGYREIEQLKQGDFVYSVNKNGSISINKITKTTSYFSSKAICIVLYEDVIITALKQKLYELNGNQWIKAKSIVSNMQLLSGNNKKAMVYDVSIIDQEIEFFDIRLDDVHTFCVSTDDICT